MKDTNSLCSLQVPLKIRNLIWSKYNINIFAIVNIKNPYAGSSGDIGFMTQTQWYQGFTGSQRAVITLKVEEIDGILGALSESIAIDMEFVSLDETLKASVTIPRYSSISLFIVNEPFPSLAYEKACSADTSWGHVKKSSVPAVLCKKEETLRSSRFLLITRSARLFVLLGK